MFGFRTESSKMDENINVVDTLYSDSMMPNGWVVIVSLTEGDIIYGSFASKEDAIQYGKGMVNATIKRMFFPTIH